MTICLIVKVTKADGTKPDQTYINKEEIQSENLLFSLRNSTTIHYIHVYMF